MKPVNSNQQIKQAATIRWWPAITLLLLLLFFKYGTLILFPGALAIGVLGALASGLGIFVWWTFFSRAEKKERLGGIVVITLALIAAYLLIDVSIKTGGSGMMYPLFAIPFVAVVLVIWVVISTSLSVKNRRVLFFIFILLGCAFWTLLRIDGITGDFQPDFAWRWAKTHEEKLLSAEEQKPAVLSENSEANDSMAVWPGFRGLHRDGVVNGLQLNTDWSASAPQEMWRRPVGPGCSSFAVGQNFFYTQEQLGEDELVCCYQLNTGKLVWKHSDKARFWDSHAGAGPRATPTIHMGRIFTQGGTGILNAINISDGSLLWTRNTVKDAEVEQSGWGYSGSPLIVDDIVIVSVVGKLMGYDIENGEIRWTGPDGGDSYSSPHLLSIENTTQVLLLSAIGVTSLNPNDGSILWKHALPGGSNIVQPAITNNGDLLIGAGEGLGLGRFSVKKEAEEWKIREIWSSTKIQPNFNDMVVHEGYAYGYSGSALVCIDLTSGERKWRGNRYGGQLLLLSDQNLLLVLSEKGKLALVKAQAKQFEEVASLKAIEGKTWNHPVVIGDVILIRNTEEMAAFKCQLLRKS